MATTFLDLIILLLFPLALSAIFRIIFIKTEVGTDEISEVVKALTQTNDVEQNAKRGQGSFPLRHFQRNRKRRSRANPKMASDARSQRTAQSRKVER